MPPDPQARQPDGPLIFISAAEPSADLHGASLIRAVRAIDPTYRFVGVAGPKMQAEGCVALDDWTQHAAMLLSAVGLVGRALRLMRRVREFVSTNRVAAAVVIDSPALHLPMGKRLRRAGVPVLYYIAPQFWAWGAWRMPRLRRAADSVAAILPFEENYFRRHGIEARFVGHPLLDACEQRPESPGAAAPAAAPGHPSIALLPGSRRHVVKSLVGDQLAVAAALRASHPNATIGVSVAGPSVAPLIEDAVRASGVAATLCRTGHSALVESADLVLVASGTTTLEVALQGRPMIVMYQASRLAYHLVGRWVLSTRYLSLPNILAGREVVPEFMPYYGSLEPVIAAARRILDDAGYRQTMIRDLAEATAGLAGGAASRTTAAMLVEMVDNARGRAR